MTNFSARQNSHISKSTSSINQTHIYISSTYSSYTIHPSSKNPQTHKQLIQTPDLGITSPSTEHFLSLPLPFSKTSAHAHPRHVKISHKQRTQHQRYQPQQSTSFDPCKAFGGIAVGFRLAGVGIERCFPRVAGGRGREGRDDG